MRLFVFALFLFAGAPFFLASSCEKGKCPQDVVCTEIFSMVTVSITDHNAQPVKLDETYTIRVGTQETIRPEQSMEGVYVILDDNYRRKLQNEKDEFRFVGMKDGRKVVDEVYTIGADCCHVQKIQGKESIKL